MRRTVWLFAAMALLTGQDAIVAAHQQPPVAEVTGRDELTKQKGYFRETWVHPEADLTRYSKLYLWQALFQFRDVGEARSGGTTVSAFRSEGPYPVAAEDRARFKQVVVDAFVEELQRSRQFELVDAVGPDTLILRGGILDIISNVPPNVSRRDTYLSAVGEGTFVVQLIDSRSGVMQAVVGERRRIQPPGAGPDAFAKPANFATVWADIEQWARGLAADFRRELDAAKKKADKK